MRTRERVAGCFFFTDRDIFEEKERRCLFSVVRLLFFALAPSCLSSSFSSTSVVLTPIPPFTSLLETCHVTVTVRISNSIKQNNRSIRPNKPSYILHLGLGA